MTGNIIVHSHATKYAICCEGYAQTYYLLTKCFVKQFDLLLWNLMTWNMQAIASSMELFDEHEVVNMIEPIIVYIQMFSSNIIEAIVRGEAG